MKDSIKIREYEKIIIVDLPEFINSIENVMEFQSTLMKVIGRKENVALNMKATVNIDSGVVVALLEAERAIQRHGKQLYIIAPSAQAKELLSVTYLTHVIPIINDEKDIL